VNKSTWTDERIERLRQAWADPNVSISMLVTELDLPRGAIANKAARLNLGQKVPGPRRKTYNLNKATSFVAPTYTKVHLDPVPAAVVTVVPVAVVPVATVVVEFTPLRLPFPRTGDDWRKQCPWPMWDDPREAKGNFVICGREIKRGKYCAHHGTMAYTRPKIPLTDTV